VYKEFLNVFTHAQNWPDNHYCVVTVYTFFREVSTPVTDENRLSDNDILAEFNGGKILRKDLDAKISKLPPQIQGR
jgi:hypothetical protein